MQPDCWFFIDTFVHIAIKKNRVLLYNSFTGKILEFRDNPLILSLLKNLRAHRNLGVILLTGENLESKPVQEFVSLVRENFMGELIQVSQSRTKPIQMIPIINNQKDVVYLKKDKVRSLGEDILDYLKQVTLFINDTCDQRCTTCLNAYQQIQCCYQRKNGKNELPIAAIERFLSTTEHFLYMIEISGGDIFKYSRFRELLNLLNSSQAEKMMHINYAHVKKNMDHLKLLENLDIWVDISVFFPLEMGEFRKLWRFIRQYKIKVRFNFITQGETDFITAGELIQELVLTDYEFVPFYNGNNYAFFKDNLFIKHSDIEANQPKMIDIYRNEMINSNYFGKLWIAPDGGVFSNLVERSIGNLQKHSVKELLIKALSNGKSWRRVRKNVSPCKACTFQNLCPPISNLNKVMGKNNLCHMNDN